MLVPLSWLKDFTPVNLDPALIAETLTDLGLVVEGIKQTGEGLDGIVVGRVLDVRQHPDADKVRLADVDLGDGQPLQIACGAPNLEAGQLVPVATIGAVLPGDFKIERRKLRGEWSNGMICSESELGFTDKRSGGIMVLSADLKVGQPLLEALKIEPDVVFDLAIETNRPDAMCISGVARDLAARLGLPFAIPEPVVREGDKKVNELAAVTVERPDICQRFSGRVITGVKVGPSSELIQRRLALAGMRPINNVVDASNYVMLELGQPSHPFDLEKLPGRGLIIRGARDGETLTTLDGTERKLTERDGVVCDANDSVVAIAGIMGGSSSEISEATTTVFNEAAIWDPYILNFTSRRLSLRTDASARFERKVDYAALNLAQNRFCELVQQSSPEALVAKEMIDVAPTPRAPVWVSVRTARVNSILGTNLTDKQIKDLIEPLGFKVEPDAEGTQRVTIPTFRPDSDREIDVIEEVARIYGYSNIPKTVPKSPHAGGLSVFQQRRRALRNWLLGYGINEAWTATLLASEDFEKAGLSTEAIELANPIVAEESKLRTSMLPGMLRAISFNATRRNVGIRIFDVGHVFNTPPEGQKLPDEQEHLAVALSLEDDDAMSAAELWRDLCAAHNIDGVEVINQPVDGLHPTRSAVIRLTGGQVIGQLGEVDPSALSNHNIDRRVGWLEVELTNLLSQIEANPQMRRVSKFPAAEFDLAFLVPNEIPAGEVERTISQSAGEFLERLELFDVFHGNQVGEGRRSLAYRLTVASPDSTLSDQEVAGLRSGVIQAVEQAHGASLRD